MEGIGSESSSINDIKCSLDPYIKQRDEAIQIRRVLAAFLSSHVKSQDGPSLRSPCSLIDGTYEVEPASSGLKGIRKDYLRCLRANVTAKKEFARVSRNPGFYADAGSQAFKAGTKASTNGTQGRQTYVDLFLSLVKQQRKRDRLQIIQNYMDTLSQRPAATFDHLDQKAILRDIDPLPEVPMELIGGTIPGQATARADPKQLIYQLEKAVLHSKVFLKQEQEHLATIRANAQSVDRTYDLQPGRLEALGTTRNELMDWIETELSKPGASQTPDDSQQGSSPEKRKKDNNAHLLSSKNQYLQYTGAREALLFAVNNELGALDASMSCNDTSLPVEQDLVDQPVASTHLVLSQLQELVSLSNEQRAIMQQRTHLSSSLAKQLKEAGYGFDRLADESHLLSTHSVPAHVSRGKHLSGLNGLEEEILAHERPNSVLRVRTWISAAEAASANSGEDTAGKLEESEEAIGNLNRILSDLQFLIGNDLNEESEELGTLSGNNSAAATSRTKDIWATLDCNLGGLKADGTQDS